MWAVTKEDRDERADAAAGAGLGQRYQTAWTWLHKLRRALVRPGRDRRAGYGEVDETFVGGVEEGVSGRWAKKKALLAVAAEDVGQRLGRIRLRRVPDASATSLQGFIDDAVEPGSQVHTDGGLGYERRAGARLPAPDYVPLRASRAGEPTAAARSARHVPAQAVAVGHPAGRRQPRTSRLRPRDEVTCRFNRRRSRHRGRLFYRVAQQAVQVAPVPYTARVKDVGRGPRRDHKM